MPDRFSSDVAEWVAVAAAAPRRSPLRCLHDLRCQRYATAAANLQALPQANSASRCPPPPRPPLTALGLFWSRAVILVIE